MSEVEFFNKYFEGQKEIYKLVGIMEFYRYRFKVCKIRNNVGDPPTISILFPLDDNTIPYILDVLFECNIDYSTSYRISTPHYLIEGTKTITINREPSIYVKPRYSTLLAKGDYQKIFEEKKGK
jgi:hypothetical protein